MAKITLTTIKKFIRENRAALLISTRSSFDGMIDCVSSCDNQEFRPAVSPESIGHGNFSNALGIAGAWFVFGSRDRFEPYEDSQRLGYLVYNCCGSFILAIPKAQAVAA